MRLFPKVGGRGVPVTFPLYAFFFTQAFLTGSKQNYARAHKIEIDKVDFDYEVLDGEASEYTEKPADGVYCFGMSLDGCAWSSAEKSLCESEPKVLYVACPGIHMIPAPVEKFKQYNHYSCPLYKTADRRGILSTTGHSTNFVMDIRLPCAQSGDHWIRRGRVRAPHAQGLMTRDERRHARDETNDDRRTRIGERAVTCERKGMHTIAGSFAATRCPAERRAHVTRADPPTAPTPPRASTRGAAR